MIKFNDFIDKFIPEEVLSEVTVRLCKHRTLLKFVIITFPIMIGYTIDSYFKEIFSTLYVVVGYLFFLITTFYILVNRHSYTIASHVYSLGTFLLFFGINFVSGFHMSPQLSWFVFFPLIPAVLQGKKQAMIWTGITIVISQVSLFIAYNSGFPWPSYPDKYLYESTTSDLFIGPMLAYILVQSAYSIRELAVEQLAIANRELVDSYKEKRVLLSILFHDLSNHLTLAQMSSDSRVLKQIQDEKVQKYLNNIHGSLMSMSEIITSVREQEMIRSGKLKLKLSPVAVKDIYDSISLVFNNKFKAKNIQFLFENDDEANLFVLAERVSLTNNVFNNLVSNSIKFSQMNSKIIMRVDKHSETKVKISITDFGMGIPNSLRPNLFDYEMATNRAGSNGEKGSGYGLPIVKSTVDRFEGEIIITSNAREDGHQNSFSMFSIILNSTKN